MAGDLIGLPEFIAAGSLLVRLCSSHKFLVNVKRNKKVWMLSWSLSQLAPFLSIFD